MRGCRWQMIGAIGLAICLAAGCLRNTLPPQTRRPRSNVSAHAGADAAKEEKQSDPLPSDYQVSRTPAIQLDVQPAAAIDKATEKPAAKPGETVQPALPLQPIDPPRPFDSPQPSMEVHSAPLTRPDAPSVQVLRALLDHHAEEEINEQLKSYDPATREALLLLLSSVVQLEQVGGMARIAPRDLAAWTDRLNTLTTCLRGRAQLILERMCFCSYIKNFGDFAPLPPEHTFFQPGEVAHVYVQVRNFSTRRQQDKYVTVLKGRMEIYDANNRATPPITWTSAPREDASAAPRQDYYINFRFPLPRNCPPGLYTMRIAVEDWTDAPPDTKQVAPSRIAQRTLDFRVGGPIARPSRDRIAEANHPPGG